MRIIAPHGSPLHAAVIGVADLDRSWAFYRDVLGLESVDDGVLEGEDFARFWHLPASATTRYAAMADRGSEVGRIVLMEFDGQARKIIRDVPDSNAFGLMNVNFYTADIERDAKRIGELGYSFWSAPVRHQMTSEVGSPTEVIFDGPDNLIINLVELSTTDPGTRIGEMRNYVHNELGLNAKGFTPVVTSLHASPDMEADIEFYRQALGMEVLFRDTLGSADQNHFSRFPEGSHTRCAFLQGGDMFGKICLTQPVDYSCPSLAEAAVAPNIGYLAQAFVVSDLAAALERGHGVGATRYSPASTGYFPGLGEVSAAIVRSQAAAH
jgi:catechol 2,3-dioxygenase-like lactoylglutathione lyase family enzyme